MIRGDTVPRPAEKTIADAYTYLLGRMLVIRQEHMDRKGDGFAYNAIKYNPLGSADFVNPNLDVAYLEAWIAVDADTPALLEVPEITGRYYTAQLLDEWGEVIVNINERTFPSKPFRKFALVGPGLQPEQPFRPAEGVRRLLEDRHGADAGGGRCRIELVAFARWRALYAHIPDICTEGDRGSRVGPAGVGAAALGGRGGSEHGT